MTISQILRLLFLLVLITLPIELNAQTVVSRARIGGYSEDITYVTSGNLKDQVVMTNGYELYAASLSKKGTLTRVCRIDHPEFDQFANGFAFVESEGLFVMNNAPHPNKLFFFDQSCASKGTRTIQYLNSNYRPGHLEGMAHIPNSSPLFPDHLIMVAWDDLVVANVRVIIMRRDGVQVAEISRQDWPAEFRSDGGLGDVTFLEPNRLLVSVFHPDSLWIMDFNGNILSGPLPTGGAMGTGEGVVQMSDGRLVASSYPQNLLLFDKNLNRLPQGDLNDVIGLNLNLPHGIAWDSDANRFLVTHDSVVTLGPPAISGVATTLASSAPVVDLSGFANLRQTVYLPQEDIVATLRPAPGNQRAILLFNVNGTFNSEISLSPASLGQNLGGPQALAYLPGSDEFVVSFSGAPPNQGLERPKLRVFSRAGALVRTIDISATGTGGVAALEFFQDQLSGEGRLIMLSGGRVFVTDLTGNSRNPDGFLLREFNSRVKFGLITRSDIAAITSGPLAGAFAIADGSGGEVVIFRLDD
jgi:hypothetical protein